MSVTLQWGSTNIVITSNSTATLNPPRSVVVQEEEKQSLKKTLPALISVADYRVVSCHQTDILSFLCFLSLFICCDLLYKYVYHIIYSTLKGSSA